LDSAISLSPILNMSKFGTSKTVRKPTTCG
jgi:hypothetical protein